MTDTTTLADEIEERAVELEAFYSSKPGSDTAPPFADTLRRAATAIRERDRLREALHFYADRHEIPSEGPWGVNSTDFGNIARAALSGGDQ